MEALSLPQLAHMLGCSAPLIDTLKLFSSVAVDSRLLKPNDVFFALRGAQVDGHEYLSQAAANGASCAVVSNSYVGSDYGLILLKVEDTLQALQTLTTKIINSRKVRIVAVTGSVGKTTTKDLITTLLKTKYRVASSPGNHNSQIGLPLTILNHTQGDEDVLVLEMGMTSAGHIANLVQIAPPDIAVVTMVALNHVVNFSALHEIAAAKAEIFSHPKTTLGILPRELADYTSMASIGTCPKLSFSLTATDADFTLRVEEGFLQVLQTGKKEAVLSPLTLPGKHNLHNFLAAIVVARHLHVNWEDIQSAIPQLALPERRLQHVEIDGVVYVNDSYNAVDVSVKVALDSLPTPKHGCKVVAVIGQMLELGKFSEKCHQDVGEYALSRVDNMICLGKECEPIYSCWTKSQRSIKWCMKLDDVVSELQQQVQPGDVVLLKGSRANQLWRVLDLVAAKRAQ
jgi:UDP-N-acetylmuramoyl-tripeptide--D-alanyl-D-alanine ligase